MNSTLSIPSSIPISRRKPDDRVSRGDETYRRSDIDRPIKLVDFLFSMLGVQKYDLNRQFAFRVRPGQYPENTPSQVAARVVQETGRVAIADIGCGTANTLLSCGNKVASQTKCGLGNVSMVGVSRHDFRGESQHKGTNQALRSNVLPLRYEIGDARNMVAVEDDSQDVVYAYNSLRYSAQPDVWLHEMLRIGRPGGTVLFNSEFEQAEEGQPLVKLLDDLHDSGFNIARMNLMIQDGGAGALPVEWQMMCGTTENAVLFRVDIPAAQQN